MAIAISVTIQPTSAALGNPHTFAIAANATVAAIVARVANYSQFRVADVCLFFGGQLVAVARNVMNVPGFQDGFVMKLHAKGLLTFQAAS